MQTDDYFKYEVKLTMENLDEQVEALYDSCSREMADLFFRQHRLPDHLKALQDYILFSRGDFVQCMLESLGYYR